MKAEKVTKFGLLLVLGMMVYATGIDALAQTRSKRPQVRKTTATSYRYAYEHGYRGGYEDGYLKGKETVAAGEERNIEDHDEYYRADRTYNEKQGTRLEYQEGYRIGFEIGYNDGYFGRASNISIPSNLGKVVIASVNEINATRDSIAETESRDRVREREPAAVAEKEEPKTRSRTSSTTSGAFIIPDGTQLKIRLTTQINTKTNREGDRFLAVVLNPSDYAEATVEGHIAKLNKSGKATGKTELSLAFDSIQLRNGRSGRLAAQVEKVYESESVKTVDDEGNVQTSSRTKETAVRGVGGAALGAIIGGIAGGGKGAAIGAAIGAGVGAGSVFIDGGKDMILEPGTEMLIRTSAPDGSNR